MRIEIPSARAETCATSVPVRRCSRHAAPEDPGQDPPLPPARLDPLVDRHPPNRASRVQETGRHSGADGSLPAPPCRPSCRLTAGDLPGLTLCGVVKIVTLRRAPDSRQATGNGRLGGRDAVEEAFMSEAIPTHGLTPSSQPPASGPRRRSRWPRATSPHSPRRPGSPSWLDRRVAPARPPSSRPSRNPRRRVRAGPRRNPGHPLGQTRRST